MKFLSALLLFFSITAHAFDPNLRVIQIIVPFAIGGGVDLTARNIQKYADEHGIKTVVLNHPGANGLLGVRYLSQAAPDGNTIGLLPLDSLAMYNVEAPIPVTSDRVFTVSRGITSVVTGPRFSRMSLKEVMAFKPSLNIGYMTPGQYAIMTSILAATGNKNNHVFVPYKNGNDLLVNLVNGEIDLGVIVLARSGQLIDAGKLHLLAVDSALPLSRYSGAMVLDRMDPDISKISKGVGIVLPPATSKDVLLFWKNFTREYVTDASVVARMRENFNEPLILDEAAVARDIQSNSFNQSKQ